MESCLRSAAVVGVTEPGTKTLFGATAVSAVDQNRFVVPFGAYIVHFATFILTAIVLVRERVAGTLQRMFVNGYRQAEIVAGISSATRPLRRRSRLWC